MVGGKFPEKCGLELRVTKLMAKCSKKIRNKLPEKLSKLRIESFEMQPIF